MYLCAKDMYIFYKFVHVQKYVGGSESMYLGFIGLSLESVWVVCPVTCEGFIYFSRDVQNVSPVEILYPIGLDKNFKESTHLQKLEGPRVVIHTLPSFGKSLSSLFLSFSCCHHFSHHIPFFPGSHIYNNNAAWNGSRILKAVCGNGWVGNLHAWPCW